MWGEKPAKHTFDKGLYSEYVNILKELNKETKNMIWGDMGKPIGNSCWFLVETNAIL